jgi:transposase
LIAHLLLPVNAELHIEAVELEETTIVIRALAKNDTGICPYCATVSQRVHSRYVRQPIDLACAGYPVRIRLQVRRFFCENEQCKYRTFAERSPMLVEPYARRTTRLAQQQMQVAFEVGGEAGARILKALQMPISPDTLIRLVRQAPEPEVRTPRVLGVDDWAKRKGQSYGTILVDLERQQPIDLLPERSATVLIEWLQQHPGVEVISRDRGSDYSKGATVGAPQAIQVADRWHLLKNLRETLERFFERNHNCLRAAALKESPPSQNSRLEGQTKQEESISAKQPGKEPSPALLTKAEQDKQARRAKRLARYEAVHTLHEHGLTKSQIAKQLKMGWGTVAKYLEADSCPFHAEGYNLPSKLDPYLDYLEKRWQADCHNGMDLWRELESMGFNGSRGIVARWVAKKRRTLPIKNLGPVPRKVVPWSPSRASWLFIKQACQLTAEDKAALARMHQTSEKAALAYSLGQQFTKMVRERCPALLVPWFEAVLKSGLSSLVRFAEGLRQDLAALSLPWSSGQVEGQINRLKFIKRQGYGRANFDLLRKRVLGMAT